VKKPFLRRVRRMLLLVPAAWSAGPRGLPLEKAVALTGAGSVRDIEDDVAATGSIDLAPSMPEDFLAVSIEGDRVIVDSAMRLVAPPPLSLREGAMLIAALQPFERDGGRPVTSALRKLRRAIPEVLRRKADELARGHDFQVGPPGEWADSLEEAIEKRLEVTVEYRAEASGTVGRRRLEPRLVFPQDGRWYLAAWNVEKGEEHLYRLDRIVSVEIGTRSFGEHKGPSLERYATKKSLYFQSGSEREVTVRFTGNAAQLALERWPETATKAGDGSVTVKAFLAPGNFLLGWVLGYGGKADILSPADVREQFAVRVEELRRLYAD